MRTLLLIILLFLTGCTNPKTKNYSANKSDGKISHPDQKVIIPARVTEYLNVNFPDWNVPDTLEYIQGWCFLFNKSASPYFKDHIPYFVTADLNDDNFPDYALILKDSDSLRFIILENSGTAFKHFIADDFKEPYPENGIRFGLYIEPPRQIDCIVNNIDKSLILKSNGVAVMKLEEMIKVYYWEDGIYHVFEMK